MQYHHFSQQLNDLQLQIPSLARCVLDSSWHSNNAKAPFTRIYFPIRGQGQLICQGQPVTVQPGYIYLIPADTELAYRCDEHLEKIFAHICIPRPDRYDLFHGQNRCVVLPDTQKLTGQLIRLFDRGQLADVLQIRGLLLRVAAQAVRELDVPLPDSFRYSQTVKTAIDYIDMHLSAGLSAQQIAAQIHLSANALQKRFRAEVGTTLGKYIRNRLAGAAACALHTTDLSVRQISEELGYRDQFYFSKAFTAQYGVCPTAYRRQVAQGNG